MSSNAIVLSKEFAYPAAAALSTFYVMMYQYANVAGARKRAKIDYPQLYAEKAEAAANKEAMKFNCAQRAHQQTIEVIPMILGGTLIGGLTYPVAAASLCGLWSFTRIFYTIGYSSGDPKKRNFLGAALFGSLAHVGLLVTATASAVALVRAI